ncbi:MAG: DUF411 domain-containing protein [Proteobacteria bacterium]|nr:DUF411 domain-containing protein [Pseudomonadota bacterium]
MKRRDLITSAALALVLLPTLSLQSRAANTPLRLLKDPNCGCCEGHAAYLKEHGFNVSVEESGDLAALRAEHGIPESLTGCHMIFADDYIIEGHVPAAAIKKLLAERPAVKGISLPGMPAGSPGMGGEKEAPFIVYVISGGEQRVFMTE